MVKSWFRLAGGRVGTEISLKYWMACTAIV